MASYFLRLQKVTKNRFRGENTDSTSGAEVRALAHSIFPLKTPEGAGISAEMPNPLTRRAFKGGPVPL